MKRKRNRKRKHSGNEKDIDDKNTEDSVLNSDNKHCQEHEINEETNEMECEEKEINACLMHIEAGSKQELNTATEIKERSLDKSNSNRYMAEGKHRAGFDAFMTGFSFATFLGKYGAWKETEVMNNQMSLGSRFQVEDLTNRLYLSGKSVPLLVEKSHFSKTSSHHREKFQKTCPPTFKHVTQVVLESVGLS
ncbi:target of EGR1 protein 1-like [Anneissia japonica]|uniref:target of EGR1 protein 1-like n=1 Tax=Anneissia japonica TaxID=1529436 RepID=UPI0014257106|nr:target of EGR1 protein 1-like [Anneissia japonica]